MYDNNISKLHQQAEQMAALQRRELLLNSIKKITETRIRTSFIFPVAELERLFGFLWGHEISDKSSLTPDQLRWLEVYKEFRKNTFDNGNSQIRSIGIDFRQLD